MLKLRIRLAGRMKINYKCLARTEKKEPEGAGDSDPPPLENPKAVWFTSNIGS